MNGPPLPEWLETAAIAAGLAQVELLALAVFLWHDRRRK